MFDEQAGVFYDEETRGAGFFRSGGAGNPLLQPECFGVDGYGSVGHWGNFLGAAEDVHDVDGLGDIFQARVGFFAEDFRFVGIDRDNFVSGGLEVGGDFVRRAAWVGGEAHYGDGFGAAEKVGDGVGGVGSLVGEMKLHTRVG